MQTFSNSNKKHINGFLSNYDVFSSMFLLILNEEIINPIEVLEIRSEIEATILKGDLAPRAWALLPYRPASYHRNRVDSIQFMWFQLSQNLNTSRTSRNVLKDISPMHLQNISCISVATHITSHGGSTTCRKIPGIFKIRKLGDEHTVE